MELKYRKSLKLIPGVRLNITHKGISSVSIGRRNAGINISRRGVKLKFKGLHTAISPNKRKKT